MSRSTRDWTAEKTAKQEQLPFGLVSRVDGDQRLKDPKVQEEFWSTFIQARYQAELFKLLAKEGDELSGALSELSLDVESGKASTGEKAVMGILADLRKLREGILASHRHDAFALTIYEANVRLAVLAGKAEHCLPALRGLVFGLGREGRGEFEEMYLLHLVCSFEFQEFYSTTAQLKLRKTLANHLAHALIHSNYISYWRLYTAANPYQRAIMRRAEPRMRERCLDVVGKVYYTVDVQDLGRWTNEAWRGKGWREEGGKAVVREVRRK
ncbi:hypothetical protein SAICODRAFT_28060 [Saitoella complicata NRRL Y-17804]|uniref:CSN8/PSMD8/EIF3K domain-containing protein n=1 Tax=Saitoella complicata (strain BCRC 22490 / CBS 7301 / JCM 7358 / NBRC 10748 / NRRL Y-17804) TaxID=698492 RepID=A0A0E9NCY9_SAICN|nr:uncharacterized protein SAICODRAFT_28060 [Saitoella complicata NRRL Y-17804]ODQ49911.1 hypothetical protein SAICODRAFT_28060 [Saitoella complicata NRRL Y-17804]GAO47668.1 hypothetical protein G7K_1867-t1 [Saitoella complicata NRRL Y-17804]